ncbi:MAG TPA: BatA domain-containing protein, partial [Gemmataceae bacterium]|nr:BatA domain-containing protein [Gemmataceae bacterium]
MPTADLTLLAILFDTPLTAMAVATGAASIPFIIHLLNRNRYRVVTWGAMRFLLAAQKKNTRRIRLEQLILLAIRMLIILLLVVAMASVMPWTEDLWRRLFPGKAASGMGATRRTHKILVLDGSFSMDFKVGEVSCFDKARSAAARILQESARGDGFSVILMASPPRRIVAEPADDSHKVADEIQGLRLPHGNADLAGTLIAVEDLVSKSPDKYPEKEVYFLTDLQRSTWIVGPNNDTRQVLRKIQNRARTVFLDVGQDGANNWAITDLSLGPELVTTGATTSVTATVHNFGSESGQPKRLELWVGKARTVNTDPPFEMRVVHQEVVQAPPGESRSVNFPYKFTNSGDYAVQVRLENDGLDLDDFRTVVVSVKDTVPVLLVNGKPAVELYDRATEWLKDALNPFAGEITPRNIPARPKVVTEAQFADAGLGELSPYDCVFICDVARLSPAEIRRLESHLQKGGGVVFCVGPQVDFEAYNRLLYREGKGILPARLKGRMRASADEIFSFFPDEEAFKQPPLKAFAGTDDRICLMSARFREYLQVDLPEANQGRTILSFMSLPRSDAETGTENSGPKSESISKPSVKKDPALIAWSRYRGRIVLLTTTVNMDWTTWPISPSYLPFMQELLRFTVS